MGFDFRAATLDDATFWSDVYTAAHPNEPLDPVMQRYEWEHGYEGWIYDRRVARADGRDVGVVLLEVAPPGRTARRFASVSGEMLPAVRSRGSLATLFAEMEGGARSHGAELIAARTSDDDRPRIDALRDLGYREDRRGKKWELDLVANRDRLLQMATASRERMRHEGIALGTLASDEDPERYRKTWRMSEEAANDVPSTLGNVGEPFEDWMDWLRTPGMHEDRVWIARDGDDIVGMSVLEYPPVRGVVGTAWTATARRVRGRGIARALKCETLAQAIALGVDRVRTGNDGANDPILHINESMGYRLLLTRVDYLKDL